MKSTNVEGKYAMKQNNKNQKEKKDEEKCFQ